MADDLASDMAVLGSLPPPSRPPAHASARAPGVSGGLIPTRRIERMLPDQAATERLADVLAGLAHAGDVITLAGDLGTGKTTFARAFIRGRARSADVAEPDEVPSPTFTLVEGYELPNGTVWHIDLYRLERPEDVIELGVDEAFADGISLIEWPDRAADLIPAERLALGFDFADRPAARRVVLTGSGAWAARVSALARHG